MVDDALFGSGGVPVRLWCTRAVSQAGETSGDASESGPTTIIAVRTQRPAASRRETPWTPAAQTVVLAKSTPRPYTPHRMVGQFRRLASLRPQGTHYLTPFEKSSGEIGTDAGPPQCYSPGTLLSGRSSQVTRLSVISACNSAINSGKFNPRVDHHH